MTSANGGRLSLIPAALTLGIAGDLLALKAAAYISVVRWLSDRRARSTYWAFTLLTSAAFVCLLSFLICVTHGLLLYVHALGLTVMRAYGLAYAALCYALVFRFLWWALRKPGGQLSEDTAADTGTSRALPGMEGA